MDLQFLSKDFKNAEFCSTPDVKKKNQTDIIVYRTFNLVPPMIQKITCKPVVMVTWTNKQKGSVLF